MANVLVVHKNRTNIVSVSMGMDVSTEVITSEIRSEPDQDASLIAVWDIEFESDGTDGELILTLNQSDVSDIPDRRGWMDIKRVSGGAVYPVFDRPLEVEFRGTVTT